MYNNTMISFNMLEASRVVGTVKRFFYASSACIYPEFRQLDVTVEGGGLKEADAWPAQPQDAYGLEKLASEELAMVRVGGGREKNQAERHTKRTLFSQPTFPSLPTALRQRLWHRVPHRPLPQHLRPLWHVEGGAREGARRVLPQSDHEHQGD